MSAKNEEDELRCNWLVETEGCKRWCYATKRPCADVSDKVCKVEGRDGQGK